MGVGSGTLAPLPGAPLLSGDDARRGRTKDGRVQGERAGASSVYPCSPVPRE